jgi:RNA polymerase-binding transcription factor DksA
MEPNLEGELRAELARIAALAQDLSEELAGIVLAAAGDVPDDEHDVEGSSIGFERARVTALLQATEQRRIAVEAALAHLSVGTDARCAVCGRPIDAERLVALPGVTTCVTCAAAGAGRRRLPR